MKRRRVVSSDEEDVVSSDDEISLSRSRVNEQSQMDLGVISTSPFAAASRANAVGSVADYEVGSIIKLKLHKFAVYRDACAHFGPHMNMILGPNGAGKSTLLNAICLVLGGKTSTLGRQKHVKDFVRQGEDKGWIEITLAPNTVIKREIARTGGSRWWINGKESSEKALKALTEQLHLQVDNLCQFLPQDRVSDFSGMNMFDLLENTLKAIGDQELGGDYEKLKELGKTVSSGTFDLEKVTRKVDALTSEKDRLEKEVEVLKEHSQLRKEVGLIRVKKCLLDLKETDKVVRKIEKEASKVDAEVKKIETAMKPGMDKIDALKKKLADFKQSSKREDMKATGVEKRVHSIKDKLGEQSDGFALLMDALTSAEGEIRNFSTAIEATKVKLADLDASYAQVEAKLGRGVGEITKEMADVELKRQKVRDEYHGLAGKKNQMEGVVRELERGIKRQEDRLNALQGFDQKKLNKLRGVSDDAYRALCILRDGSHGLTFEDEYFEPPLVSMEIPDPKMKIVLETYIHVRDLTAFVFRSTTDMNIFLTEMRTKRRLKVNAIHVGDAEQQGVVGRVGRADKDILRSEYGVSAFVDECFRAPPAVKAILCRDHGLCDIPVGGKITYDRVGEIARRFRMNKIFVDFDLNGVPTTYNITCLKSKYSSSYSTSYNPVRPKRLFDFGGERNNEAEETSLRTGIQRDKGRREDYMKKLRECGPQQDVKDKELKELDRKYNSLKNDCDSLNSITRNREFKVRDLADFERQRVGAEKKLADSKEGMAPLLENFLKTQEGLRREVDKHIEVWRTKFEIEKQVKATHDAVIDAEGEIISLNAEKDAKKDELLAIVRRLEEAQQDHREKKKMLDDLRARIEQDIEAKIKLEELNAFPDSVDELDKELEIREQRMACDDSLSVSRGVVKEYQKVKEDLERFQKEKTKLQEACNGAGNRFQSIFDRWKPKAELMVKQIDDRFREFIQSIGCAGQVSLNLPEELSDVGKYGAEVMVKFRLQEPLAALSSTKHSGGERSVCTMIYMMSMQELTKVPFRCVDEINQGMDGTNEKRVFGVLTKLAKTSSAQYILLTPKLIPGLEVAKSVTVLNLLKNVSSKNPCWFENRFPFSLTESCDRDENRDPRVEK